VQIFFFDQSIGFDETNTFQLKFLSSIKIVGAIGLGGLWALKRASYFPTNLVYPFILSDESSLPF